MSSELPDAIYECEVPGLERIAQGKVRDIFAVDDEHLLIVASDRLSAYDVVLPDPVPEKGAILTEISRFWFARTADIVPNHLSDLHLEDVIADARLRRRLHCRSMLVRRLEPLPMEAVVRGYLIGSGWREYQAAGAVCGIALPPDLEQAAKLDEPVFTPATKAPGGQHDENIDFETLASLIGAEMAKEVRRLSLAIYTQAADYARERGIIVADTKLEFGLDPAGRLYLIDELLTPDSSRFWPLDQYRPGTSPPSFDKQYVRDYLDTLDWNKRPPAPRLPPAVIAQTAAKYRRALELLTADP